MKAILLAAGLGTRLRPITNSIPKCLVSINGVPLLQIWLELLVGSGITEILINTHYLPEMVEEFIQNSKYKNNVVLSHESSLLGTAGSIFNNLNFIGNESVMVIHADNLSKFNINEFINTHKNRPKYCNMTMMIFHTDDPKSCGIVEVDKDGVVTNFYEKISNPPSSLANAAVYIMDPILLHSIKKTGKNIVDISNEIIPSNLGKIFTYLNTQYHRDIGTISSLKLANSEYRN